MIFKGSVVLCPFLLAALLLQNGHAFAPALQQQHQQQRVIQTSASSFHIPRVGPLPAVQDDDDEVKAVNPYADPNYPDLEFVNYDDPEYQVDQGSGDEFYDSTYKSTEDEIEEMREERRQKNDEYQFETYYQNVLRNGAEYKGEWTVYKTSTFIDAMDDDPSGIPRLAMAGKPLMVISKGERITGKDKSGMEDRLLHVEKMFVDSDEDDRSDTVKAIEEEIVSKQYSPDQLSRFDFRGQQGIMCVGNCYTTCRGTPLIPKDDVPVHEGPFEELFAEIGIQSDSVRFRIKLDYSVRDEDMVALPPLHLRTMTVCRETLGTWPRTKKYTSAAEALVGQVLFGPPGAPGGLYDPPPVGSEEQAAQYMMLDLDGGATVLFPYLMDQDPDSHPDALGWVTSLDWTPGRIRFQVDRKTMAGKGLLGLRTLECSEVQGIDAETYRPRDGGQNMRQ
jgi:hypothetical protein